MNAPSPFSFQSKWDFDIKRDYLAGKSDSSVYRSVSKARPGFKANGIYRQVDFSPRYHQISLQKEATNTTTKHTASCPLQSPNRSRTPRLESNDLYKQRLLEVAKLRRRMSEEPSKDFRVSMHCSCKDDDRVKLAQDRLSRVDHPYKNPKPHDFRPVGSSSINNTTPITSSNNLNILKAVQKLLHTLTLYP